MCGIAGLVNLDGAPVDLEAVHAMRRLLSHRGPDGEGFAVHGNVGLAHRRLAIIDPKSGVQPFYSDDRQVVVSYNGEVYNYLEIRRELEADVSFHTTSDTEVVLKAYERWGMEASLEKMRGMFATALLDQR